jgi:hypothetical protein
VVFVERAAALVFGIKLYVRHVNIYMVDAGGNKWMWVEQPAGAKPKALDKALDNVVSTKLVLRNGHGDLQITR